MFISKKGFQREIERLNEIEKKLKEKSLKEEEIIILYDDANFGFDDPNESLREILYDVDEETKMKIIEAMEEQIKKHIQGLQCELSEMEYSKLLDEEEFEKLRKKCTKKKK